MSARPKDAPRAPAGGGAVTAPDAAAPPLERLAIAVAERSRPGAAPGRRRARRWLALVLVAAVAPYLNSLGGAFVFDDFGLVIGNPMATPGMSPLAWLTRESMTGSAYRPVTMLTYALDGALSGGPLGYHVTNVVLHALATAAAFGVARLLLGSIAAAGVAAVLFAVHPIHTEAVANVAARAEVLAGLGVLASVLAFLRAEAAPGRRTAWHALGAIAFGLALFSKESAATGLGLLVLAGLWTRVVRVRDLPRALAPYAALTALSLVARRLVIGSLTLREPPPFLENPLYHVPAGERIATAIVIAWQYVSTLVLPIRLSADDSYDQVPVVTSLLDPRLLVAAACLAAIVALAVALRRRAPVLWLAAAFFTLAMALTANVLFPIGTIKGERLLYTPSFAWCLALGWLARRWAHRDRTRWAVVCLAIALLGARTMARNLDWRSNDALFLQTVVVSPGSARAQANAAAMLGRRGDYAGAIARYEAARAILPSFPDPAFGLGLAAERQGRVADALGWYEEAVRLEPRLLAAYLHAGALHARAGARERALAVYRRALASHPNDSRVRAAIAALDGSTPAR